MNPDRARRRLTGWLVAAGLLAGCSDNPAPAGPVVIRGETMGTVYSVKISHAADLAHEQIELARRGIDSLLQAVNAQMSCYLKSSEISRFNYRKKTDWFLVSAATARIIEQSLGVSRETGGTFDITVGPLVNLWGFGPPTTDRRLPTPEEITRAMARTGYARIAVRLDPPALKKDNAGVYCDLAAIAKGYGVDEIARYLDSAGLSDYLVEIGGEMKARGRNDRDQVWQIGIETPDGDSGVQKVASLVNCAMATSGDYRNYFETGGVRYSHLIDPRTGQPIRHRLASVTVIHDSCWYADAMATAINILGPADGYALALGKGLAALLVVRTPDGFVERMTPQFESLLAAPAVPSST